MHLHGASCRGSDFRHVLTPRSSGECDGAHGLLLLRPLCPAGASWSQPAMRLKLVALLDEAVTSHDIDETRVYLSGASMGGDAVWMLAAANPRRFAALVPICARADPAIAAPLRATPIWMWHGVQDAVYPICDADAMVEALVAAGSTQSRLTRLDECATPQLAPHAHHHAAWLPALEGGSDLWRWLLEQKTIATPPASPLVADAPSIGRAVPQLEETALGLLGLDICEEVDVSDC